jgi:hypothetical protein
VPQTVFAGLAEPRACHPRCRRLRGRTGSGPRALRASTVRPGRHDVRRGACPRTVGLLGLQRPVSQGSSLWLRRQALLGDCIRAVAGASRSLEWPTAMSISSHRLDSSPNRYPHAPGPNSERVLCPANPRELKCGDENPATVALCDPSRWHAKKTGRTQGRHFSSSSKPVPKSHSAQSPGVGRGAPSVVGVASKIGPTQ